MGVSGLTLDLHIARDTSTIIYLSDYVSNIHKFFMQLCCDMQHETSFADYGV